MSSGIRDVYSDLCSESTDLCSLLSGITDQDWDRPTPAPGWTIADQIAHLALITRLARLAATDPTGFAHEVVATRADGTDGVVPPPTDHDQLSPAGLTALWRGEQDAALDALAALPPKVAVPWLPGPARPSVIAAAVLLEVFAHGQDVRDALGVEREHPELVGHIAFLAHHNRDVGYRAAGLTPPEEEFRFELTAPSGAIWSFGPAGATERITGPAADLSLLVGRRRHRDDLALIAEGDDADLWLDIAQAYPGPAGRGRTPGQFR